MRQPRLKAPPSYPVAYYHCISRVVDRQFVFGEREKEKFVELMREYEGFCGVRLLTFCILSNHFHLLVEVPRRPETLPSDEELLTRIERLSGLAGGGAARQMLERFRQQANDTAAEEFREKLFGRMWDLSAFMKLLKQRFSQWFNTEHGRKGTLWEERFKSVLVEGAGDVLLTMAVYIDLNPVRANIVPDPKDYRWCGYAEAMAGRPGAREALRIISAGARGVPLESVNYTEALANYRVWMFGQGEANEGLDEQGQPKRAGFSREAVAKVIAAKGRVPLQDYVRMRVRYFVDGTVLGTRGFVDQIFHTFRGRFSLKRKDGARRLKGIESKELFALRDLKLRVVT